MNKWISVKKILPPSFIHVVCYCPGINGHMPGKDWMDSDYCIGEHSGRSWKRVDNENIEVSHWIPLPPPPKQ